MGIDIVHLITKPHLFEVDTHLCKANLINATIFLAYIRGKYPVSLIKEENKLWRGIFGERGIKKND